ncbi:MAG: glycogen synthase GlgA [Planctomycetota bacterium]|nr:glycogen synthase GlgA [Planctomycetota bacterium]
MRIVHVSPEIVPFAKTGGLADVVGALPAAIKTLQHDTCVFMPLYKQVKENTRDLAQVDVRLTIPIGNTVATGNLWRSVIPKTDVVAYFVQKDEYYHRDQLYGTPQGDFKDNSERFIFFAKAVLEAMKAMQLKADIVHCHDWQSAMIPVYLKTLYAVDPFFQQTKSVLTVHNMAYQGVFWHWDMKLTGLDWSLFNWKQLEFYGKLNFLKGGVVFADAVTTVSPRYAAEVQSAEFGCGLEGVLTERRDTLFGIINGIDYSVWNPEIDPLIPAKYSAKNLAGKAKCKEHLQKKSKLPVKDVPVLGMIGRLADQKGMDLVAGCLDELMTQDVQMVILGAGEEKYHKLLHEVAEKFAGKLSVTIGFDNQLAHEIEAGADMFLMPSRYEPCGLNQLYSLKYGTIPVVRETGGLADTVTDARPEALKSRTATGFVFQELSPEGLMTALTTALAAYGNQKVWKQLMKTGMAQDWSWKSSAEKYVTLYKRVVAK